MTTQKKGKMSYKDRIVKWIVKQKLLMGYSNTVCQTPMVAVVTAISVHDKLVDAGIFIPTVVVLMGLFLILFTIGHALFKLGFIQAEMEFAYKINPEWNKLSEKLDKGTTDYLTDKQLGI